MLKKKFICMAFIIICCAALGVIGKIYSEKRSITATGSEITYTKLNITEQIGKVKQVAITFDDGPHAIYTKKLLEGLEERDVKATFFLIGKNIEGNEDVVREISEGGHLIGNHTYDHVILTNLSVDKAWEDIYHDNEVIYKIIGEYPEYIRPPFGCWSEELSDRTNLKTVLWDVDPRDWECQNAQVVYQRVINNVESGDIILMHDIFSSSVEAALSIIDELKAEGYEFVTVDKLATR